MGYFHTDSPERRDVRPDLFGCDATPSARERYHAAIVYGERRSGRGRPAGNLDVDVDADAASSVHLAPLVVR